MDETKTASANPLLIPASIVVAGVLIAGAVVYSNLGSSPSPGRQTDTASLGTTAPGAGASAAPANLEDDDPVLGNPEAKVSVVEFSDFQCPFCRRLYRSTLPLLKDKYIKTGQVKFVYRDFPLPSIHDLAQKYAEAGECADEQGRFWDMHDKIFNEQDKLGEGTISSYDISHLKRWAREIGIEGAQFDSCLDSGKYAEEVAKDFADGQRAGVQGTPATFVNGRLISGAVPFTIFEQVIEEELKKAE